MRFVDYILHFKQYNANLIFPCNQHLKFSNNCYFTVNKLPLGYPCDSSDVCLDKFGSCEAGICRCRPSFYPRGDRCVGRIPLDEKCMSNDR